MVLRPRCGDHCIVHYVIIPCTAICKKTPQCHKKSCLHDYKTHTQDSAHRESCAYQCSLILIVRHRRRSLQDSQHRCDLHGIQLPAHSGTPLIRLDCSMCLSCVEVSKSLKSTVRVCMCVSFTVRQLYSKSPPHLETQMSKHSNQAWCTLQKTQIQTESGWLLTDTELSKPDRTKTPTIKNTPGVSSFLKKQKQVAVDSVISKREKWL